MHYNKQGKKIELLEWGKLLEDSTYKIIKQETLSDGKWVSTVWIGLDHQFGGGLPLIFETMVFSKEGEYNELDMDRYSTLEEAQRGHETMVQKWANKKG
mgnify:FL=1